jgi:glycosyltransferase involved in cell wall biosynthesis
MGKVVYVTAKTPFGKGETFTLHEMVALKKKGVNLLIIPRNPSKEIFHKEAEFVKDDSLWLPPLSLTIVMNTMKFLLRSPTEFLRIVKDVVRQSCSLIDILKGLVVLPKSLYVAKLLKDANEDISHIHAHSTTTVSIMAHIIARKLGIPWSFTLHAATIVSQKYARMFKMKLKSAEFVRCIANGTRVKLVQLLGHEYECKVKLVYVGVDCDTYTTDKNEVTKEKFVMVTPAELVPRKGHRYLIEACSLLVKRGFTHFMCYFYGDGPLRGELQSLVERENLKGFVELPGLVANEKLLDMYRTGQVDVVILPSIVTDDGNFEGIPMALEEAMAYGIPVVSTNTGDIPELIGDGSGVMVKEKDPQALADAIERLLKDAEFRRELGERGRRKVVQVFSASKSAKELAQLFYAAESREPNETYATNR